METFYQQLINLFTSPPGNLIYHIVLAFAVTAAIQGILIVRRSGGAEYLGRVLFGLGFVLAGQVALFLTSGLAWQGLANPHVLLPPLDRAVTLFSLIWIVWLWAFPRPSRLADALVASATVIVLIAFLFTLNQWNGQPQTVIFNGSFFDSAWEFADLGILLAGLVLLALRRPETWGVGLGFLLVNLIGHAVQFLWPPASGDFSGITRLAQLCSFPLLPVLAQRLASPLGVGQAAVFALAGKEGPHAASLAHERRRYSADPRAVQAWLEVAAEKDPSRLSAVITRAVAQTMLADISFYLPDPGTTGDVCFQSGYDLIREEEIPGLYMPREKLPSLTSSLLRGRPYRLDVGSSTPDLKSLAERFGLKDVGSLLLVPLATNEKKDGGFLFLSPYSNRNWTLEDQAFFSASISPLARLLHPAPGGEAPASSSELANLHSQLETARQENQRQKEELERLRLQSSPVDLESMMVVQREAQETIATLQAEIDRLHRAPADNGEGKTLQGEEIAHLETELRKSLQEIARLQNMLAEANIQVLTLQKQVSQPVRMITEEREVVASISQELRQPMASVIGYTDLLMSESAGILGALQRKFLERIKTSIERMRSILDDLVQVVAMQDGNFALVSEAIQAGTAIDQALNETRAQLQEKNIVLEVDLPDELPELHADRDAIQQILVHLLQNAGSVTPPEGTISLKVRINEQSSSQPFLLFQITDSGGGIAPADLPRVFSRRYRADNPLIQGVGDTGVGLSIAKTLTEAHGGRIWVESEAGKTTTFSVLLPVQTKITVGAA